ncbi:branched chain amino acid aminotransferase apoenzyme [Psychromonas ingrahamii 37]|uniref:Branched-chain-amino-acid aminotransferase n=1 Tax=Psychromonas ingrahamii (strain DSM 17664 / CCUG 51855 / 37) TaxID=357804 RepID=A1SXV1_PSYIN|nr:branched-chain amino acid aminotransferase [Psychromonas ingrahamii]ABM04316.1 branched chain amino acid aminotransferase apoenzyme [Psychromonas ingrahamii 37]
MIIDIKPLELSKRGACPETYSFGADFSDHMFSQNFEQGSGWEKAEITPYHALTLDPSAAVFHYGQEIFEGLKAYRSFDGTINLFRPSENFKRFNRSAKRMAMPEIDGKFHLKALKALISLDHNWIPEQVGSSLYIRPTMIATGKKLGLGASDSYIHFIITGPAGSYFKGGFEPVSVYIADKYRRAVVGGVGEAKTGGNYAASLYVSEEVEKLGYSQVLWLDAVHGKYIEEVGAMNICFVYENKHIVTPALSGSILPGITRDSILKLAPALGFEVSEERLDIEQILADIKSGKITEAFGCGTAAVISPVGKLCWKGTDYIINNNKSGEISKQLYDELTGIQYGTRKDRFGWIEKVDPAVTVDV